MAVYFVEMIRFFLPCSERSIRDAFLLQARIQSEQDRTQEILDNIFPPHGMKN